MVIQQGAIHWVDLSEPIGSAPGYRRPCMIMQNDAFNRSKTRTVVICPLTTNLSRAHTPGHVLLGLGEANLSKASVLVACQVTTVDKSLIGALIGAVSQKRFADVLSAIVQVIEPR